MIKPNELSIGNIVFVENELYHPKLLGVPLKVTSIEPRPYLDGKWTHSVSTEHIDQKHNEFNESYSQFIKFINPIPLTEEWLLRFGFTKRVESETLTLYWIGHNKITHDWLFEIKHQDGPEFFYRNGGHLISYVHQLQNLYFALTGEELALKQ